MERKFKLHIVSHTHWDREWYLSFQLFRRRLVKLIDHLIKLFDENQEFKSFMMDGQTLAIKDYLEIRPEMENKIIELVKDGRIIIGPWFTQPNEFLVSGESLIRNLILGLGESEKFGGGMQICYLPDAFGHISQLPQILCGFSMEDAVVWRGVPTGSKTVFKWMGSDDSECLVHYMCSTYGNAVALPLSCKGYEEHLDSTPIYRKGLIERMENILEVLSRKTTNQNLLLMNGIDHAFAQNDLPDVIKEINEKIPGIKAVHSTLSEYIKAVRQEHEENEIPYQTAAGELRDSTEACILPGSQSTRINVKIINNRIEGMFEKWMEPFLSFSWMLGFEYPQSEIWKAWEYLLENHAHDSLACSSVDSAYHQILTRFEWAEELGNDMISESLQRICKLITLNGLIEEKEKILVIFNPLNWYRSEAISVVIDVPEALMIKHPILMDGEKTVPMVIHNEAHTKVLKFNPRMGAVDLIPVIRYEATILMNEVPGIGYKALKLTDSTIPSDSPKRLVSSDKIMENEYIRLEVNYNGTFNIIDKLSNNHYESLHYFEDCGEAGDGFRHKKPMNDQVIFSFVTPVNISVVEDTSLKATIKIELNMDLPEGLTSDRKARSEVMVPCSISSLVTMVRGVPRVDIKTSIINRAKDHRLRVVFPTGIKTEHSYAEQPFDVVKRKIKLPDFKKYPEDFEEEPSPTHPQLSFVDITNGTYGLMIANQGLYEYEVKDNEERSIAITLLRCTNLIYSPYLSTYDAGLIPEAECIGEYTFQYSVIPHRGNWENAWRNAYEFKFPMKAIIQSSLEEETISNYTSIAGKSKLPEEHSFIKVESPDLQISAIKKNEFRESLIIRLFNPTMHKIESRLTMNFPGPRFVKSFRNNLKEEREAELIIDENGSIKVTVDKKKLFTVELI
ncbi:MAG: hypothetical protein M1365_15380 [Actinobacteria bacterium]|nr:hypothetical protein [Actinomycetota bacterium]